MKGDSVVILHGWGSSSRSFGYVKDVLTKEGFSVYAPDLPGFGVTPEPSRGARLKDYVQFVLDFVDRHDLKNFYLIGHSFGGQIAVELVAEFPRRVKGLVLYGAATVRGTSGFKKRIFLFISKLGKKLLSFSPLRFLQKPASKIIHFLAGSRDYYRATDTMKSVMRNVLAEDVTGFLPSISVPTLIICGERDDATPLKEAKAMNVAITHSSLEIIGGGGHSVHQEQPEEFLKRLTPFLMK